MRGQTNILMNRLTNISTPMNAEEIFKYFDKEKKMFLSKNELQASLIYKFGFKFPKSQIDEIWHNRKMSDEEIKLLKS